MKLYAYVEYEGPPQYAESRMDWEWSLVKPKIRRLVEEGSHDGTGVATSEGPDRQDD